MESRPTGVVVETSMGDFAVELYWDHSPKCCRNFSNLARDEFYKGLIFHRVIRNFMIQGGDPTGTGKGGQTSRHGTDFNTEIQKELKHTGAGIVAMAANSGSQFYVTLAPTPWVDGQFAIFGRISAGMRVIERIGLVPVDGKDKPKQEIRILGTYTYDGDVPELNRVNGNAIVVK
mmetsp:Transcript_3091/g.3816  ORF Transcript_3091/g.3816 Transcript_3091/m.3816 type:complete len:175 (-) Transcript_3091:554-1078(-)|eukprot:CAMPEP_0204842526 /NCGR_PEP_ID=MMETSP1346-20131115/46776_1 /ASSEMBLY_ACC=CAM_ASM_000771 /TAXON_ID=215587 /ORGANISM="Aplanochytrium stocchinoi, Strain GSBS06" /LENGTH=174 /DNA_ID=CAMNT_0051981409 /DNA_START=103 /DNA_END=627 /DNA_ORIENTATION=-